MGNTPLAGHKCFKIERVNVAESLDEFSQAELSQSWVRMMNYHEQLKDFYENKIEPLTESFQELTDRCKYVLVNTEYSWSEFSDHIKEKEDQTLIGAYIDAFMGTQLIAQKFLNEKRREEFYTALYDVNYFSGIINGIGISFQYNLPGKMSQQYINSSINQKVLAGASAGGKNRAEPFREAKKYFLNLIMNKKPYPKRERWKSVPGAVKRLLPEYLIYLENSGQSGLHKAQRKSTDKSEIEESIKTTLENWLYQWEYAPDYFESYPRKKPNS
jgi:hypothetical protein